MFTFSKAIGIILFMNSLLSYCDDSFKFLFLGDIHYHQPGYTAAQTLKDISDDIKTKKLNINFVCHTGDFIENQKNGQPISLEDGAKEWEFAIRDVEKNFQVPFFMSLGNHDWYGDSTWFGGMKNIEKYYYPFMAKELGKSLNGKPFFSFRWGNSYFLFTNHVGYDTGLDKEQRVWLEKSLRYTENNPAINHVFIFGHPNLWNVGYFRFNENHELLDIISEFKKVDAYFCGHTHHNNASVWNFEGDKKLLQINGSPLGKKKNVRLSPIGEQQLILNPPPAKRGYTKGFEELYSYFIVSVNGPSVTVALELIGGEKIWEFTWASPGEILEKTFIADVENKTLKPENIKEIKEARLHLFPYVPETIFPECRPIGIEFNGKKIAELPRSFITWHLSKPKNFVNIPPELVKTKNKIVIDNPNNEHFAVRDCYLELILKNNEKILTPVYPYVLFAGDWKDIYMDFGLCHPTAGRLHSSVEVNVPEELIKCSTTGEKITFDLNFKDVEPSKN